MKFTPKWELLRSFGSSRFAKLSVFVPIFGYFIIFNDAFVSLVGSSTEWACHAFQSMACTDGGFANLDDDFMLRKVVNIYIALSAIGLSTVIFQALCPHEVKKFWHVEDYVAANTKVFHHEFNRRIRAVLDETLPAETKRIQDTFNEYKQHDRPKASEMYDPIFPTIFLTNYVLKKAAMRIIEPPRDQHPHLRQPLTAGELRVLDVLDDKLPPEWEIYLQPHFNGLKPDFVLLEPNVGIGVIEVKDWNLDAMPYFVKEHRSGRKELYATGADGRDFRVENPFAKIRRYKEAIYSAGIRRAGCRKRSR